MRDITSVPHRNGIQPAPKRTTSARMLSSIQYAGLLLLLGLLSTVALAVQEPANHASTSAPASEPAVQLLTGIITNVKGMAEIRPNEDAEWTLCQKGMAVPEGSVIRTGTRSAVTLSLPQGQEVVVDRLTICQLLRSREQAGQLVKTDLGMKYGRTEYKIERGGLEYRSSIRSPDGTLSVRGTVVSLYDQRPFAPQATSFTGRATYNSVTRTVSFGGKNAGRTVVRGNQDAASVALSNSVQDPVNPFARTSQEAPLVANLLSTGTVFTAPVGNHIPTASGGIPPSDAQLMSILPGALDFVLRWSANADLNLVVGNQAGAGEVLLPAAGLNSTSSGGRIPFNHLGGPSGGIEIAFWPHAFPQSIYFAAAEHVSGAATPFTLEVFEHGQLVPILNGAGQFANELTAVSDPGSAIGGNVFVGIPSPPLSSAVNAAAYAPARHVR